MKKKLLIISILFVCASSYANVREFQIGAADNSIIRIVDEEKVLVYTQQTIDSGFFVLYNYALNTALAFHVPIKCKVHDVRVYDGTDAFFCGTYGDQGLIGMFRIASVFAGTDVVHYTFCDWTEHRVLMPTDLKRLDLFEYGGNVHMAMTGTSIWGYDELLPNTTVMSAYLSGTNWNCCCYSNKDRCLKFTDVACLEDLVVAVGPDSNGIGCYMKTFSLTQGFPNYPTDVQYMTKLLFGNPVDDVLAVHEENNTVLMAQFNKNNADAGTTLYEVDLDPVTGGTPTSPFLSLWRSYWAADQAYTSSWHMLELNYSDGTAWMLQRADYAGLAVSGVVDWLQKVPLVTPTVTAHLWNPHLCHAQSIDMIPHYNQPWLSGKELRLMVYNPSWIYNVGYCYRSSALNYQNTMTSWDEQGIDEGADNQTRPDVAFIPDVFSVRISLICDL